MATNPMDILKPDFFRHEREAESDESTSGRSSSSSNSGTIIAPQFHAVYTSLEDVPYTHVSLLGEGSFGFIDKVIGRHSSADSKRTYYARKRIRLQRTQDKLKRQMALIKSEVEIVRKLSHPNIARICGTYECGTEFGMLITPIADGDLKEYMEELDESSKGASKLRQQVQLCAWIGSLVDALAYLHTLPICHKDIKPANILVKEGSVYITDFGIAKDLINETTTASTGTVAFKSPMYSAPEVLVAGRRGRSSDVYSMGCVFLELLTLASSRSLLEFTNYRTSQGSRAYANNEPKVIKWIQDILKSPGQLPSRDEVRRLALICFLMLAPSADERITMGEVAEGLEHFQSLAEVPSEKALDLFMVWRSRVRSNGLQLDDENVVIHEIKEGSQLVGVRTNDGERRSFSSLSCYFVPKSAHPNFRSSWIRVPRLCYFNPRTDYTVYPNVSSTWVESTLADSKARYASAFGVFLRFFDFEWTPTEGWISLGETTWDSARLSLSKILAFGPSPSRTKSSISRSKSKKEDRNHELHG